MAETTQEKKTFKWGDNEYLLDDLLKLHSEQEQNYYNFARDRGQYDDTALAGLRAAISSRISAVKNGQAFSADGILNTDKVDNTSIQTQKKGLFKKEKYVDQDNTEWAKYYLNKLVGQLKPHQKEAGGWDISKHGLSAYLTGQGLNAQDIFEKYDGRDANNPNAARSFTQRDAKLKEHLGGYKTWLEGKGFDFTKNDNEWDDNFMTTLSNLVNNQDWSDRTALAASLRKLGAGDGYTTAFTSDRWDLSKSDEELAAERDRKKNEDEAKIKQGHLDEFEELAFGSKRASNPLYYQPFDYSTHNFNGKEANFMNWYGDLNASQQQPYGTYLGRDNQKWNDAWVAYTNSLKGGPTYSDKNVGILLQGTFANQPHGFIDLGDNKYLIRDSVTDNGQGTVYDPRSGYTDTVFLGDLAGSNAEIKNIYKQLAYKYANNKYGTKYEDRPDVLKDGGELVPKHQYGNKVSFNWETTNESVEPKAEANNVSVKTQKAKDKYVAKKNASEDNPEAGLTTAQMARIGYAMADLTSAIAAFAPGAGTVVSAVTGLGSTIGNFVSDLTDDAVTGKEAWRNFGMNLGMDALGLIPGGGAASKMGKIVKSLKTVVPTVIAIPGVAHMLANSPEIAQSWKRAFDGSAENGGEKMTYQDYMNILQVLNVVTAGTSIGRNVYKSSKVSTKQANKLAIDVLDANKQRKAIVLEGDDVTKFKEANAKGEAQKFINELEGEGVYTINEITTSNKGKFWGKGTDDKFHIFNQNPFGQTGTGKANVLEVKVDTRTGKTYADTGRWADDLLDGNLVDGSATRRYNAEVGRLQGDLDTVTDKMKQSMSARIKRTKAINKELTPEKAKLAELQAKLHGVPDIATLQSNKTQLETDLASNEALLTARQQLVTQAEADLQKLLGKKRVAKKNRRAHAAAIASARGRLQGHKSVLQGYESTKQRHTADIANIEKQLQLHSELPVVQAKVTRLEGILNQLNPSTHTHAYNKLQQMVNSYQTNHSTIEGRTVNWDMTEILNKAGIRNAFKQGGSVNRSKINKFLNYAKG